MKTCYMCGETFPLEDGFHVNSALPDGRCNLCKSCNSRKASKWKDENPDKVRDQHYTSKYGISYDGYLALLVKQFGSCKICGVMEDKASRQRLFVDHCHETGEVRGLLCHHCNSGLGYFLDDAKLLATASNYILLSKESKGE